MSEETADIVGTTGSNFTFTIDSGAILAAFLEVPNQPKVELTVAGNEREVTVPSLPAGDSSVRLDLVWAPQDPDATIDVGKVTSGTVKAAIPKHTIDAGDVPGFVQLFGK